MPTNAPRQTKAERREQARAEALALREQQQRREKRTRLIVILVLVAAVVGLVFAVRAILSFEEPSIVFQGDRDIELSETQAPSTANDAGGIPVGTDLVAGTTGGEGAVEVQVYYDYMCPFCGQFEQANAGQIESLLESGGVTVIFQPLSFQDHQSRGREYSTRVANAAAVVADRSPEHFLAFHNALLSRENQPAQQTAGLSDSEIAELAEGVGVPADVVEAFTETVDEPGSTERVFAAWTFAATEHANEVLGGITTPTVLINGERWPGPNQDPNVLYQQGPLVAAVTEAKVAAGLLDDPEG